MKFDNIKTCVASYYSQKLEMYGNTPQGVDWNSVESQELRFKQLLKVCNEKEGFSINDLGCGFGSLYDFMSLNYGGFEYFGYDVSENMINEAKRLHKYNNCKFFVGDNLTKSSYSVASGIFNVKLDKYYDEWTNYVIETINNMNEFSTKGFSFNILTKYSDKEFMKDYLYYADPCFFFDYCKRNFSRNVALLHDYQLYEFTILVRKEV